MWEVTWKVEGQKMVIKAFTGFFLAVDYAELIHRHYAKIGLEMKPHIRKKY